MILRISIQIVSFKSIHIFLDNPKEKKGFPKLVFPIRFCFILILHLGIKIKAFLKPVWNSLLENVQKLYIVPNINQHIP